LRNQGRIRPQCSGEPGHIGAPNALTSGAKSGCTDNNIRDTIIVLIAGAGRTAAKTLAGGTAGGITGECEQNSPIPSGVHKRLIAARRAGNHITDPVTIDITGAF